MGEQRVNIGIDEELWRQLSIVAATKRLTKKQAIAEAIREYVERNRGR